jgi:acetyl esterase/lipase
MDLIRSVFPPAAVGTSDTVAVRRSRCEFRCARRLGRTLVVNVERCTIKLTPTERQDVERSLSELATKIAPLRATDDPAELRAEVLRRQLSRPAECYAGVDITESRLTRTDHTTLGVREYRPSGPLDDRTLLYVHGGGWTFGTPASFDHQCVELARLTGLVVRSLAYRLAPEHPFPAAIQDVHFALSRYGPIIMAGESAGASLAMGAAMLQRDTGGALPTALALWYPVAEPPRACSGTGSGRFDTPLLRSSDLKWYWRHYGVPAASVRYAAPGLAPNLGDRDPTAAATARLAARLAAADVPTLLVDCPGFPHAFTTLQHPAARKATAAVLSWVGWGALKEPLFGTERTQL